VLANLAMMNIPPSEAEHMSLYDYEAMLWNWNEAHRSGDDIDPPDPETTMARLEKINADPRLTH
jgi:hypothetical protein